MNILHYLPKHLLEQINMRSHLTDRLRDLLPSPLAEHCFVLGWNQEVLSVGVDHAHWILALRSVQNDLYRSMQHDQNLRSFRRIEIKRITL